MPTMSRGVRAGGEAAPGVAAVAQHDEAIRHRLHFLDEVRDVDDRDPARLQAADEIEQRANVRVPQAAGRLVEHEHAAAGRERARDFDELLRRRLKIRDTASRAECRRDRAVASRRPRSRASGRDGRCRAGPARRRARCFPSRSDGAPATVPDRSSPRRRGVHRTDRAARTVGRPAASRRRPARSRRQGSPSACSCRRRSDRRARTPRLGEPRNPPRRARTVAPNALPTPRISKRGALRASAIETDPGAAALWHRRRSCDRA